MSERQATIIERIEKILIEKPWLWNNISKILPEIWKDDIEHLKADPVLLSTEGFLQIVGQEKLTDPQAIMKAMREHSWLNRQEAVPEFGELDPDKVEIVGYFMTECGRYAGALRVVKYFRVLSDGTMAVVDLTRGHIYKNRTFGSKGFILTQSDKSTYDKAYEKVINQFNQP